MVTEYITPDPNCKICHGRGEVYDWVPMPFGSGNCRMPTFCDCVIKQLEDEDADIEIVYPEGYAQ